MINTDKKQLKINTKFNKDCEPSPINKGKSSISLNKM